MLYFILIVLGLLLIVLLYLHSHFEKGLVNEPFPLGEVGEWLKPHVC